jgi:hypothetical protein
MISLKIFIFLGLEEDWDFIKYYVVPRVLVPIMTCYVSRRLHMCSFIFITIMNHANRLVFLNIYQIK